MIPAEIVTAAIILWLGFKAVAGWMRSRTLERENARLMMELSEARGTIAALTDQLSGIPPQLPDARSRDRR